MDKRKRLEQEIAHDRSAIVEGVHAIEDTVGDLKESAQDAVSFDYQVGKRPLFFLATAFSLGWFFGR